MADDKTMMRTKKEWCEENEKTRLHAELAAMNAELKRVQKELWITKILNNDLEVKLDTTRNELLEAQTKVYTTSQKQQKILDYINWLDKYKTEASSRVVSTKFVRDHLS